MKVTGGMGFLATNADGGTSSAADETVGKNLRQPDIPQTQLFGLDKVLTQLETSLSKLVGSVRTLRGACNDGFTKVYISGSINHPDWRGTSEDKTAVDQFQTKIPGTMLQYGQSILSVSRQFTTMKMNARYDFEVLDRLLGSRTDIIDKLKQTAAMTEQSSVNMEYVVSLANAVVNERTDSEKASIKQANQVQLTNYLKNNMNSRYPIRDNIKAFLEELGKIELSQVNVLSEAWYGVCIEIFKLLLANEYFKRDGTSDNYLYTKQAIGLRLMVTIPSSWLEEVINVAKPEPPQPDSLAVQPVAEVAEAVVEAVPEDQTIPPEVAEADPRESTGQEEGVTEVVESPA